MKILVETNAALTVDVKTRGHEREAMGETIPVGVSQYEITGRFARVFHPVDGGDAIVSLSVPKGETDAVIVEVWHRGETKVGPVQVRPPARFERLVEVETEDEATGETIITKTYEDDWDEPAVREFAIPAGHKMTIEGTGS